MTRRARTARATAPDELREYHEAPPALLRDMEQWLAVGDRREAAERVRAWLLESYALGPAKRGAAAKTRPTKTRARTARPTRVRKV